jgi:hypothetical protein
MSGRRVVVMALVGVSLLVLAGPARAAERSRAAAPAGLSAGEWQGIVDEIRQRPYRLEPAAGGGYRAANPAQGWTVAFNGTGADVRPRAADWTWGLRFVAYGYPGAERSVSVSPRLTTEGSRVDYHWDEGLTEWLRNGPDGLKQTFVLAERPGLNGVAGPLGIALRVAGSLEPRLVEGGQGVSFADAGGAVRVAYRELVVSDAMGQRMPAWFEVSEGLVRLRVDDRDALYPLTVDPIAQQAYVKASNTDAGDLFGLSVAISGDTVVVGAHDEASAATGVNGNQADNSAGTSGAAYVFVRSGGVWTQQAYLKASNTDFGDNFGVSVAISGDTIVVGANFEESAATGVNGNQTDNSGHCGAAYVFVRSGGVWSQQAYLKTSSTSITRQGPVGDQFGRSVAISGDTVVVGAWAEDNAATGVNSAVMNFTAASAGAAYVFVRSGTTWSQQAYLKPSDTNAGYAFGFSVAMFADTIVVGAYAAGPGSCCQLRTGGAYVFVRSGTTWSQQAFLEGSNSETGDSFGWSVAVSGDTVVVGAPNEDSVATGVNGNQVDNSALDSGATYVLVRSGMTWSQEAYLKASNTDAGDNFGMSVAISGDTVVAGSPWEASAATGVNGNQADNTALGAGAAYVFTRSGMTWSQQAYIKASNTEADDSFGSLFNGYFSGSSVAVSGDTVVVGAAGESSAATGINGNQADNTASGAGAAYVFTGFAGPGHTLTITSGPSGMPNPVDSGGTASLTVTAVDSLGHLLSYAWSASCPTPGANGSLSDATAASPMWTAPTNTTGSPEDCTIAVVVSDGQGQSQSASYVHTVSSGSTTFGCAVLPTYASIDCRLDGLVASLTAAQDLGKLKTRLVKMATKVRTKKQKAEGFATTKKKREKKLLKKAVKGLSRFVKKVGSRVATKLIPPGTRQMLTTQATPILADMKTLLGTL